MPNSRNCRRSLRSLRWADWITRPPLVCREQVKPLHVHATLARWMVWAVVSHQADREVLHSLRAEKSDISLLEGGIRAVKLQTNGCMAERMSLASLAGSEGLEPSPPKKGDRICNALVQILGSTLPRAILPPFPRKRQVVACFQYGLRLSWQCASRCPSAGPWRCHARNACTTRPNASRRQRRLRRRAARGLQDRSGRIRRSGLSFGSIFPIAANCSSEGNSRTRKRGG